MKVARLVFNVFLTIVAAFSPWFVSALLYPALSHVEKAANPEAGCIGSFFASLIVVVVAAAMTFVAWSCWVRDFVK